EPEHNVEHRKPITLRVTQFLTTPPREKPMLRFGPDQTKKRWSEKYTGEHFRHDLRLAEAQSNRTDQTAEQKDNSKLNKKLDREMYVVHGLTYVGSMLAD